MSANEVNYNGSTALDAEQIPDPGSGGTFDFTAANSNYCRCSAAGAEERYLPDPATIPYGYMVKVANDSTSNEVTLKDTNTSGAAVTASTIAHLTPAICFVAYDDVRGKEWFGFQFSIND